MSVPWVIYQAAGAPPYPQDARGACRLCGVADVRGVPYASWVKDTFADHDALHPGAIACVACLFCADDHQPQLTTRTGRDKPQRMRNYSHVVTRAGAWFPLGKQHKRELWALLQDAPLVVVIAVSGQKHLCFRARVGWWQLEQQAVAPDLAALTEAHAMATALYHAGHTKAEIRNGQYQQRRVLAHGLASWRALEQNYRPYRGGWLGDLAVYLAQGPEGMDSTHDDDTTD